MPSHRCLRSLGLALTLLCVLYFLQSLATIDLEQVRPLDWDNLLLGVGLSILVYTMLLIGVSTSFARLVQAAGHSSAAASEGLIVWGKANLAKYLPGNVLHFAGRQFLGARHGWPQAKIAAASLLEAGLFVLVPALLVALALASTGELDVLRDIAWLGLLVAGAAGGLALMLFGTALAKWLPAPAARLLRLLQIAHPAALLPAMLYFLLFFVGMSLIVCWLYWKVAGVLNVAELPLLIAAFLASWLIGFVVPGAPGGIGVREGTFTLLGGLALGHDHLVIVAVLMRLVTLVGEGLLFLVALGLAREQARLATLADRFAPWRGRLVAAVAVTSRRTDRSRNR